MACVVECAPVTSTFTGPVIKNTVVPNGFPLPATSYVLDPLKGAFDLGSMIRYLDHSDAYGGAEWGHPSDNIGAILPIADWLSRTGEIPLKMRDVLEAIIKAYEIQGVFQAKNAFNKLGIDHVLLVKVASTAVVSKLFGLTRQQANAAVSQAFVDGHPLRIYRQSPNTSPRKGWAAGDACMRAVHLVFMTKSGQPGFPTALTAPKWGFYDALFRGQQFVLPRPFTSSVIETVFFKLYAAEGHGISAVEAAVTLSKLLEGRLDEIESLQIRTQQAAMIIIDKRGPLYNAADRDHCMRYMIAVTLLKGDWPDVQDYEDASPYASSADVEALRQKITMEEDLEMTKDYHDPKTGKVASGLTVTMKDGSASGEVLVERPVGHPWREDTIELVAQKFVRLTSSLLKEPRTVWERIMSDSFEQEDVKDWVDLFSLKES
ncbi:unnamed protein product [Somion occarium]|uniref:2-methylcitrate dehydratase n=1 Tax=Somion occarium TaxID=3059160 RepID=A0ABP1CTR8_9APHY